jgi:hypothetical protein
MVSLKTYLSVSLNSLAQLKSQPFFLVTFFKSVFNTG